MNTKRIAATVLPMDRPHGPCGYYVSVQDGPRSGLLEGPYDTREQAHQRIRPVKAYLYALDARTHFYAYGVARVRGTQLRVGNLGDAAR